jgi:D-Tyr-tRNAtyr deacylase
LADFNLYTLETDTVDGKLVSKIGPGIVALIGISTEDTAAEIVPLANKILSLKVSQRLGRSDPRASAVTQNNY